MKKSEIITRVSMDGDRIAVARMPKVAQEHYACGRLPCDLTDAEIQEVVLATADDQMWRRYLLGMPYAKLLRASDAEEITSRVLASFCTSESALTVTKRSSRWIQLDSYMRSMFRNAAMSVIASSRNFVSLEDLHLVDRSAAHSEETQEIHEGLRQVIERLSRGSEKSLTCYYLVAKVLARQATIKEVAEITGLEKHQVRHRQRMLKAALRQYFETV